MAIRYHFDFVPDWRDAPMAFWVHRAADGRGWLKSREFDPPLPNPVPHKGYPVLRVEAGRALLYFTSPAQLRHFIEILEKNPMPGTRAQLRRIGLRACSCGHWLSRLPAELKAPRTRFKLVAELRKLRAVVDGGVDFRWEA